MQKIIHDELNKETLVYFQTYLLDELNKNKLTVNNIVRTVKDFIVFLEHEDLELNAKSIKKYLHLIQDSLRESSFITKVSAVRQFVNWLNIENNPFLDKDFNFNRTEIDYFTQAELDEKISHEQFSFNELLIRTFYEMHLSIDDLINLRLKDFNQANASFVIRGQKIFCSEKLASLAKQYLKKYREVRANQAFYQTQIDDHFFIRENSQSPLLAIELSKIIRFYDFSLNKLKRSRIINLIKSGYDEDAIYNLLAIKISAFYDQFKPKQNYRLLKAYADFHPRSSKK